MLRKRQLSIVIVVLFGEQVPKQRNKRASKHVTSPYRVNLTFG